ncbi:hypothetical protein VPNG_01856 [Cytospora leucostoma]|uniref:2EXR domain-containing protein n=1 Tax=Cytospora leucostoma TaxID=1230097 RepID=A0A423XJ35_9PEZI|nr:hypothetical protein VPNG_01856 [Cytospora leucostoma]
MVITRSQRKELEAHKNAGFRKFKNLPKELRLMVWDAALPRYGNLTLGCECEKDKASPGSRVTSFTIHLVRPPSFELGPDNKLPERICTTRSLLMTCHESREQAKRHFPNVLTCRKGEVRFNAEEDLITLCGYEGFELNKDSFAVYTFSGKWNLPVCRLAVDWRFGADMFCSNPHGYLLRHYWGLAAVGNFLEALKKLPSLKQLFQVRDSFIAISGYCGMDMSSPTLFHDGLGEIYSHDVTYQPDRKWISEPWMTFDLPSMTERAAGLRAVAHVSRHEREPSRQPCPLPGPSPRLFRLGDDELRHLKALGMTDINPELRDKGIICTETEFE